MKHFLKFIILSSFSFNAFAGLTPNGCPAPEDIIKVKFNITSKNLSDTKRWTFIAPLNYADSHWQVVFMVPLSYNLTQEEALKQGQYYLENKTSISYSEGSGVKGERYYDCVYPYDNATYILGAIEL